MSTIESPSHLKRRVQQFWDEAPCGSKHASSPEGSKAFFDQVERRRDELEPFIPAYANFNDARDQKVLEIGIGLGTDLVRFARAGALVTGVDFSERAVNLVRHRLELEGLHGRVLVADAERLPFGDSSFDRVYSWGVLHHTPDTPAAVAEALRVLRPGGALCVMLYARRSWVSFGLWARHALLRGRPWTTFSRILAAHMESEGTKGFTASELRSMFADLEEARIDRVATPYDRRVAGPLAGLAGGRLGWFIVTRGVKRPDEAA